MKLFSKNIGQLLNIFDSRLSLWLNGSAILASASLPAWAVGTMQLFSEYKPLSWILAGFAGLAVWIILRLLWVWGSKIIVKARYDARILENGSPLNPLDLTFEGKRIFLTDLALPSHPVVIGKTFINCDLVGPANIYFPSGNQASEIRPPIVDGVWLDPAKDFRNGFTFINCIFRGCSFQRITILASVENYENWKNNESLNWISVPPSQQQIVQRQNDIARLQQSPERPQTQDTQESEEHNNN